MVFLLCPFVSLAMAPGWLLAPGMSFVIVFGYYNLNEVAIELEHPYGLDLGDLPLHETHQHFIGTLETMFRASPRPVNMPVRKVEEQVENPVDRLNEALSRRNIKARFSNKISLECYEHFT